jgi:hypothetical protein
MKIYTLRTLYLLLYLFIASQGMFYLIGINKALHNISISAFIEQRKSIDAAIGDPLRFLYFSSIGVAILILAFTVKTPKSIVFITVLISFICILADMSLAIKESIPLNEIINSYPSNSDNDMSAVRNEWLSIISYRGAIAIFGLFILLSGFLVESFILNASAIKMTAVSKSSSLLPKSK